jgi:hypothetical protein
MTLSALPALVTEEIAEFVRSGANLPADWTDARIAAVTEFIPARFRTPAHLVMFLSLSQRYGLDPFAGEIWGWEGKKKFKDPETGRWLEEPTFEVMIGRDGRTKFASENPDVLGVTAEIIFEGDEFEYKVDTTDGRDRITITHVSKALGGKPKGAYAVVRMKGGDQGIRRAVSDYSHLLGKWNWKANLPTMLLSRVKAEAISLAIAMPGVYTEAEVALQGDDDAAAEQMMDATVAKFEEFKEVIEVVEAEVDEALEGSVPTFEEREEEVSAGEEFKKGLEDEHAAKQAAASVAVTAPESPQETQPEGTATEGEENPFACDCGRPKGPNAPACNTCLDEGLAEPDLGL